MRIEVIDSAEELDSLEPEWMELWRRDPNATPFQGPQWLLPWWRSFGSGTLLCCVMRQSTGTLAAIAPLFILRDDDSGESLGLLIGTGISDYLDLLAAPGVDVSPLVEAIGDTDCQLFDFHQLRTASPLLALTPPRRWSDNIEDHEPCLVVHLDAALPEGVTLSNHARKKLRYERRTLEREGELSFETATDDSLDDLMTKLFELHAARWSGRGLPGVLADPVVQQFHRDAARRMQQIGALRMYAMCVGDHVAAVFYGFAHHDTVFYYLGGFDPALEKVSPGNVVIAHAIGEAARSGARKFDFLRGAESYKYGWGAVDQVTRRRQWVRES